jgi:hypothetical protein
VRYLTGYFPDEDVDFYFEVADDDYVNRQVERERATGACVAAASLEGWFAARDRGEAGEYGARYGGVAEGRVSKWDPDAPLHEIGANDFESVWGSARQALEASS